MAVRRRSSRLVVAIRVLAQETSDLCSQSGVVQQPANGAGSIEEFPLQLCLQRVPPHDQRRPKASQDMLLVRSQSRFAGHTGLWHRQQLVEIIGKIVVIICVAASRGRNAS
jgi:hypothetical protein